MNATKISGRVSFLRCKQSESGENGKSKVQITTVMNLKDSGLWKETTYLTISSKINLEFCVTCGDRMVSALDCVVSEFRCGFQPWPGSLCCVLGHINSTLTVPLSTQVG